MASYYLVFAVSALSLVTAEIKGNDYVYWKKADISAWHQYFPSRALQEEMMTNNAATLAAETVKAGLEDSLRRVVWYQTQELETAQLMMEGTSAQGCVQGISTYMDQAIQEEVSNYNDCSADVSSRLQRRGNTISNNNYNYQKAFFRAITGIDNCAKTYPNKDSINRLRVCVDSWNNNYFTVANATERYNSLESPSMSIFTTVTECAQTAAKNVVDKGWLFLDKLVLCAKLSENVDARAYQEQVSTEFSSFLTQNDLTSQVSSAQSVNNQTVSQIEQEMLFYYNLQKRALEKYVIESRSEGRYYGQVAGHLSGYSTAVASTSSNNPGNGECSSAAKSALTSIVSTGSVAALECDRATVNDTIYLLAKVNGNFAGINTRLPTIGNVAILSCFSRGYIFAEKTILSCFNIASSGFSVDYSEVHDSIVKDVTTLLGYERSFFSNSSLPCGDSILRRASWGAEQVLYDLQRCLYINSGTKYAVTTPVYNKK